MKSIFLKSYGTVKSNLKAVADRGWSPANRKLLEHPSLIHDLKGSNLSSASSSPVLNVHDGMAAVVLDQMITERARSAAAKNAVNERKRKGQDVITNLRETKPAMGFIV